MQYMDRGGSYMGVCTCQNSRDVHLSGDLLGKIYLKTKLIKN